MGIVHGFEVFRGGSVITHLQFVYDTFCKAFAKELQGFKAILRCFELVLGLKKNLGKSIVIGIGMEDETLKDLAEVIGCGVGKLPFTYLGLPVGGNPRSKRLWSSDVEKVKKRLAMWKRNYLS